MKQPPASKNSTRRTLDRVTSGKRAPSPPEAVVNGAPSGPPYPAEFTLGDRIHCALARRRLPVGGLIADALEHLAQEDIRQSCGIHHRVAAHAITEAERERRGTAAELQWMQLTYSEIRELAQQFEDLLEGRSGKKIRLPSGTEMSRQWKIRQIDVGSEVMGVDAHRPGLRPIDDIPDDEGKNLTLLIGDIESRLVGQPFHELGLPEVITVEVDDDTRNRVLQWKPCERAGGAAPQHQLTNWSMASFRSLSRDDIEFLAGGIVEWLASFWHISKRIGRRARLAYAVGREIAAPLEEVDLQAVAYEIAAGELQLQFMAWNGAFRRGLVVSTISADVSDDSIASHLGPNFPATAETVRMVRAAGADGRIDILARGIAEAAPEGSAAVLSRLAKDFRTNVTLPTATGAMRFGLSWRYGTIRASAPAASPFRIAQSTLLVWERVPETVAIGLTGRRLADVVELPFKCEAVISLVELNVAGTSITVEADDQLVNCSEGRIWR